MEFRLLKWKPLKHGILGAVLLLGFYFLIISLISGQSFAFSQFVSFWYFVVSLAGGFGIQVGLYSYLKSKIRNQTAAGRTLVVSGVTSTAAMISCCAHYLANILPILAVSGVISIVAQYQVQLFWVGLVFNAGGIIYAARKVIAFRRVGNSISNAVRLP